MLIGPHHHRVSGGLWESPRLSVSHARTHTHTHTHQIHTHAPAVPGKTLTTACVTLQPALGLTSIWVPQEKAAGRKPGTA